MMLVPVGPLNCDYEFLYELLGQRTPEQSISHKGMPTFTEHCDFVRNHPYIAWYLMVPGVDPVGAIYLSKRREIGVGVLEAHRRKGYAREAIRELMRLHPGRYLANINPVNEPSIRLFEELGFRRIQVTYER